MTPAFELARRASPHVAVIGSGIAGLGAARTLCAAGWNVEVFESSPRVGGHSNTVLVPDGRREVPVDTGFIIYNERTYPRLTRLFAELDVPTRPTDMSFSCSCTRCELEWGSSNLRGMYAQRRNLLRWSHHRMLADIVGFFRVAHRDLATPDALEGLTLTAWAASRDISDEVMRHFVVPMGAAIWSAPSEIMLEFPALTFLRFFANHGMLGLTTAPTWRTVVGGSRVYVERLLATTPCRVNVDTPVLSLRRQADHVVLVLGGARPEERRFDDVVVATHPDSALALLSDPSADEKRLLGAIRYTRNETFLHDDARLMPAARDAWCAWNHRTEDCGAPAHAVEVTYWMNRLQGLSEPRTYLVTLNPKRAIDPARILARIEYEHPRFDFAALAAQRDLGRLQGERQTWFAGAWLGYGFHEDGLRAGQDTADALVGSRRLRGAA